MLLNYSECELIWEKYRSQKQLQPCVLKDFQLTPALDVIGFLGDYYRLTLIYSAENCVNQSVQLFVKTVPQQSDEPLKCAIFLKETSLYKQLLEELQRYSRVKWRPTCFFTRDDVLVLEDVKESGYAHMKQKTLNAIRMRELMRALAALHAASIVYELKNQIKIDERYGDLLHEITVSPDIDYFTTGMRAVIAIIKAHTKYQSEHFKRFIECKLPDILSTVFAMTSASVTYRNVLCHRDPWAANILFKHTIENSEETESAILVDFQTCRYAPPSVDLVFATYLNLSSAERALNENDYIDSYYRFLASDLAAFDINVEQHLPKVELLRSYEEFRLFGSFYHALASTVIEVPKEMVTNEYKYIDRIKPLLNLMSSDVDLSARLFECAEDVMELALKFVK